MSTMNVHHNTVQSQGGYELTVGGHVAATADFGDMRGMLSSMPLGGGQNQMMMIMMMMLQLLQQMMNQGDQDHGTGSGGGQGHGAGGAHGNGNGHGAHGAHGNGNGHGAHGAHGHHHHDGGFGSPGDRPEVAGPVGGTFDIKDTKGTTNQYANGVGNNYAYHGDKGANTFNVEGFDNRVTIANLGKDDRVILEGDPEDWRIVEDGADGSDGTVTYYNDKTGNSVTVSTDACRDDAFVEERVQFTGGYRHDGAGAPADGAHDCPAGPETTWEVDQQNKTIKLDNGYELSFDNSRQSWTLKDAEGNVTKVWGDPHVDENGDGSTDWDFKQDSTFVLEDGTKITVGTKDLGNHGGMTVSDTLTITKGDQAIEVTGIADNNVQISEVMTNGEALDAATNDGYIFTEGDDGVANWYDANGQEITEDQAMGNALVNEHQVA